MNQKDTVNRYVDRSLIMFDQQMNEELDIYKIRTQNKHKIIFGQLNVNSLRNKFTVLSQIIKNTDVFLVSETKLDQSFPTAQFEIPGFATPYRLDRDKHGGGLMLYVRNDFPSKLIKSESSYEGFFVELNLKKQKWLICCTYNPNIQNINAHLEKVQSSLDSLLGNYERFLLLGDLNCEISKFSMPDFCESMNLRNLIISPTCYKSQANPTCIDYMLTNIPTSFQSSYTVSNSISDFHKITLAILKIQFEKSKPKTIKYRCYKKFNKTDFEQKVRIISNHDYLNFSEKMERVMEILNKEAPIKKKTVRGNNAPFMTKTLRKAIMFRTRLKNKFIKQPTPLNEYNYKKQRNHCLTILRDTKKNYFEKLDENRITDSKKFWKTIKPFFSNKSSTPKKITLIENEEIIDDDKEISETFNKYFSNIIKNLNLPVPPSDNQSINSEDPVEISSFKYKNHPSVIMIKEISSIFGQQLQKKLNKL